jgi:hypothetical protein
MPDNRSKRAVALIVERLEDRQTPSAPPAVPLAENFDTTALGQMPKGWAQWSSSGQAVFGTSTDIAFSPSQSLAASTAKDWVTAAAWSTTSEPADVEVSASVYVHHPMPLLLVARASALDGMTPTYYGLQVMPSLWIKIIRVQVGVGTTVSYSETAKWFSDAWARFTFSLSGSTLRAQVFRPDTGQYMTPAGGWQTAPAWAISATDGAIPGGGFVGFVRLASWAGGLYADDFRVFPATGDTVAPSVKLTFPGTLATLTGVMPVQATARDNVGVARVEFYVDGVLRATDGAAPYQWGFDSSSASNGLHQITVKAFDIAGNSNATGVAVVTSNATAIPVVNLPQHFSWIRVAQLDYLGRAQLDNFGQNLLQRAVDLVVPDSAATAQWIAATSPSTTSLLYTNLTTLYTEQLTSWLNYADAHGYAREGAFYHVLQPLPYTGTSPSSQPVNWFWGVYRDNSPGTPLTDLTVNARGAGGPSGFGSLGQSLYLGYPDRFREINVSLLAAGSSTWAATLEYPTAVDAAGNPTAWAPLSLLSDGTAGVTRSGQITFDPPANWIPASVNGSARMYFVRFRTTAAGSPPSARSILGRDFTGAAGGNSGVIPVFDTSADLNGDGYLNDAEYAGRTPGMNARFLYESRALYGSYGEMRFAANPSSPGFQAWAVDQVRALVRGQPSSVGVFMDNSPGDLPPIGVPTREPTATYAQDYATLLNTVTRAVAPRPLLANTTNAQVVRQTTGAFEEFVFQPMAETPAQFEAVAALVTQHLAVRSPAPYLVLDALPTGGSPTDPRTQMATLAAYYLVADPTRTFIDFFGGFETSTSWTRHWVEAAAYNVGLPLGKWSVFAAGVDPQDPWRMYTVYQRAYSNALVLYKPLSAGDGIAGTLDDATATTHALGGNYRLLRADGTLGPVVNSVTLRNGEGVILIRA